MRLRWRSRCDMRVGDRTRLRACLECLCVHRGCHLLSNLFVPCDAQVFLITLSAVCLETAMDVLVGVAQSPHRHRVRARVVSLDRKPLGRVLWPLSMPSAWHSSACVRRASRRSPERLAGPRAGLGRTWATEIQDRVHCTESKGTRRFTDAYSVCLL